MSPARWRMPADAFPHQIAAYDCPIINPPSQRRLFENKLHNIRLVMSKIQGLVLRPGEDFSFWRWAGAPTAENGYREGATFIRRQVRSALGGGLCQLSGLLYNLALLSGCRILERHNHSIDAYGEGRYIPLGRDATVAHGLKDLRFMNPLAFSLRLEFDLSETSARGRVSAPAPRAFQVTLEVSPARIIPSPLRRRADGRLAPGARETDAGLTGKRVTAWRTVTGPDGRAVRERLSRDEYKATPTVERFGPPAGWRGWLSPGVLWARAAGLWEAVRG